MSDRPKAEPVVLQAPVSTGTRYEEVRLPLSEKELARERLRAKVDVLTETASLKGQLQAEPLKMLGGASAVGAVLGLAVGSQFKRTKKIYVDANSPVKYQKALLKAQQKEKGTDLGGALFATLVTVGARALSNKLVRDRLQHLAEDLMSKAGAAAGEQQGGAGRSGAARTAAPRAVAERAKPAQGSVSNPATSRFLKQTDTRTAAQPAATMSAPSSVGAPAPASVSHVQPVAVAPAESTGPVRHAEVPGSVVEALADGAPIERSEMKNPNAG